MEAVYGFYSTDVFFAHLIFQNVKHLQKTVSSGSPSMLQKNVWASSLCVVTHGKLSLDCKETFRGKKYSKLAWRYIRSWLRDASNIIIFNISLYLHSENICLKKSLCSPALIESEKVGKENNASVGIHMRRLHCIKLQPANWTRTSHNWVI